MADAESILSAQRAKVAEIEQALDMARAELRGMEALASAMTPPNVKRSASSRNARATDQSQSAQKSGGRQPGSISMRWRAVLDDLHTFSATHWFTVDDTIDAVRRLEDRHMKPAEVRRQYDKYIELGYVEKGDGDSYRVTDAAVRKYDMGAGSRDENLEVDAHKENEPSSEVAVGSDAGWGSAPTPTDPWRNPQSSPGG